MSRTSAALGRISIVGLLALAAVACTVAPAGSPTPSAPPTASPTDAPTAGPTDTPTAPPSPTTPPTARPTDAPTPPPSAGVIVTFRVEDEQFKVLVTDEQLVEHVQALLAGGDEGRIPSGLIVRGEPGVNEPYSWHIDSDSLEFADMTMEICDGLPSHVEDGTLEGNRYCPWGAQVIAVEPAP